jgi:hypothetical protein
MAFKKIIKPICTAVGTTMPSTGCPKTIKKCYTEWLIQDDERTVRDLGL